MNVTSYIHMLEDELKKNLPGSQIQNKMSPVDRAHIYDPETNPLPPEKAAILILLFPCNNSLCTVFIQRTNYPGPHKGQISFPGGKYDISDENLSATALRETAEELGIATDIIRIIGRLTPLYISVSNFEVSPFVGYLPSVPEFEVEKEEVQLAITEQLNSLQNPDLIGELQIKREKDTILAPCYVVQGYKIWGATAMMLREFLEVVKNAEINSEQ
ncbi:MAG: CoA pyrophosphatase [Bacteroidales bacterium]|nr:CoA pyrophosphatase [Bacteroidales bacterium]